MNEYRVTIDSATEQWVYEVDAEDARSAKEQGLYLATGEGYGGSGMWVEVEELTEQFPDSCLKCGGEDHIEDVCPEFTSLQSYEKFMAEHGLNPDDDINLISG